MRSTTRGNMLFEERLIPSYHAGLGLITYSKLMRYAVYPLRALGVGMTLLLVLLVTLQSEAGRFDGFVGGLSILADVIIASSIFLIIYLAEVWLLPRRLGLRPLRVYENGLSIPPIYHRVLIEDGDFIPKEDIDHITVRRRKRFYIRMQENYSVLWYNAPVEFVVVLKNGFRRKSGPRPPEAIKAAVDSMHERWGVAVVQEGQGNGQRKRVIDGKRVELVDL